MWINWVETLSNLRKTAGLFTKANPAVVTAYRGLNEAQASGTALDAKTRELISLAVAVTTRCDGCISSHAAAAKQAGEVSFGELDYPPDRPAATHKTRAQVRAELDQARAAGQLSSGELDYPPEQRPATHKTRAEVRAELAAAKAAGEVSFGDLDYPPDGR